MWYDVVMNGMHHHEHEWALLSLYKCVTNAQSCIQGPKEQRSSKNPENSGPPPTPRLDKPVLAQRGGGGLQRSGVEPPPCSSSASRHTALNSIAVRWSIVGFNSIVPHPVLPNWGVKVLGSLILGIHAGSWSVVD